MPEQRFHGLDALRGSMMLLGLVLHSALLYLAAPPATMPMPTDPDNGHLFDLLFHFIHSFRMPTFFLLAGFFAALLVAKRGLAGTLRNRAARVLAPLLAAVLTVLPLAGWFMLDFLLSVRFGKFAFVPDLDLVRTLGAELRAAGFPTRAPALGHLWFLYYLCLFYLLLPAWRWLAARTATLEPTLAAGIVSPAGLAVLAALTAATLWPFRGALVHEGFVSVVPHPPSLLYFGLFFLVGYLLHDHRELLSRLIPRTGGLTLAALVLFPLSLAMSHFDLATIAREPMLHVGAALSHALCTWTLVALMLAIALRWFGRESPWVRYVANSAYWVYLVHLIPVFLAGWLLSAIAAPALLKFTTVLAFATVSCVLSYHYLVQSSWVSQFLNGRRFSQDWPWRHSDS